MTIANNHPLLYENSLVDMTDVAEAFPNWSPTRKLDVAESETDALVAGLWARADSW